MPDYPWWTDAVWIGFCVAALVVIAHLTVTICLLLQDYIERVLARRRKRRDG